MKRLIDGRLVPSMLDVLWKWKWKKVASAWLYSAECFSWWQSGWLNWRRVSQTIEDTVCIGGLPVVNNSYFTMPG